MPILPRSLPGSTALKPGKAHVEGLPMSVVAVFLAYSWPLQHRDHMPPLLPVLEMVWPVLSVRPSMKVVVL